MSPIKHYCVAENPEQAKQLARNRHGRQEIDRRITQVSICASEEVLA